MPYDGLLLVDKEANCTSHDVVQEVRRLIGQKKVGHCGTLDPDATGLLLLTLGRGTRLTRFLIRAPKVYDGVLCFGVVTDTYDTSGRIVSRGSTAGLTASTVGTAMAGFLGSYCQTPPPYCAKKVGGVKYYELARRGEEVPRETTKVSVYDFHPISEVEGDRLRFRLSCSSGTYARSLAHELGAHLNCGAHLASLRRLQIGPFRVDDAVKMQALKEAMRSGGDLGSARVPFDQIPLPFTEVTTDQQQERRITHGQTVLVRELIGEEGDWVKLVNGRKEFIAVGTVVERIGSGGVGVIQPRIVFK